MSSTRAEQSFHVRIVLELAICSIKQPKGPRLRMTALADGLSSLSIDEEGRYTELTRDTCTALHNYDTTKIKLI